MIEKLYFFLEILTFIRNYNIRLSIKGENSFWCFYQQLISQIVFRRESDNGGNNGATNLPAIIVPETYSKDARYWWEKDQKILGHRPVEQSESAISNYRVRKDVIFKTFWAQTARSLRENVTKSELECVVFISERMRACMQPVWFSCDACCVPQALDMFLKNLLYKV